MTKIIFLKTKEDFFFRVTIGREPRQFGVALLPTIVYFNGWHKGWSLSFRFINIKFDIEKTYFISKIRRHE